MAHTPNDSLESELNSLLDGTGKLFERTGNSGAGTGNFLGICFEPEAEISSLALQKLPDLSS